MKFFIRMIIILIILIIVDFIYINKPEEDFIDIIYPHEEIWEISDSKSSLKALKVYIAEVDGKVSIVCNTGINKQGEEVNLEHLNLQYMIDKKNYHLIKKELCN